jgi:hypothetical protein
MSTIIKTTLFITTMMASNVYALDVYLKTQIIGTDRPVVRVKTNLPDTTKVVITLYNDGSDYSEQVRTEVSAGMFESGPYLYNGKAIPPGTYTVNVAVEPAQFQTEAVQSVIGSHGEEFQGNLVRKGMLGKSVNYFTQFEVL